MPPLWPYINTCNILHGFPFLAPHNISHCCFLPHHFPWWHLTSPFPPPWSSKIVPCAVAPAMYHITKTLHRIFPVPLPCVMSHIAIFPCNVSQIFCPRCSPLLCLTLPILTVISLTIFQYPFPLAMYHDANTPTILPYAIASSNVSCCHFSLQFLPQFFPMPLPPMTSHVAIFLCNVPIISSLVITPCNIL